MIFFAATSVTWKSQCGKYELAAFPAGDVRVAVTDPRLGTIVCGTGTLKEAVNFCQEREKRMVVR